MEYRFEADGDAFPDPHNPLRAGRRRQSVVEFPGYAAPAGSPPDPGPAAQVAPDARLWSPPDADPRRPPAAARRHDGSDL